MIPVCQPRQLILIGSVISNKQGGVICKFYYGIKGMDCSTVVCVWHKEEGSGPNPAESQCWVSGWVIWKKVFQCMDRCQGGKCRATSLPVRMSGTGIMVAELKLALSILPGTLLGPVVFLWFTDLNTLQSWWRQNVCSLCSEEEMANVKQVYREATWAGDSWLAC